MDPGIKALVFMRGGTVVAAWGLRRLLVRHDPTPVDPDWMPERIAEEGDYGGGRDGHGADGHP